MKKNIWEEVKSIDYQPYQNTDNQWVIEISAEQSKLLLVKKEPHKWLLMRDKNPQILLTTRELLKYLKIINKDYIYQILKEN